VLDNFQGVVTFTTVLSNRKNESKVYQQFWMGEARKYEHPAGCRRWCI